MIRPASVRSGTMLIVVLAMIAIFLALILAMTVRVYNATKNGVAVQQNAQAYCMLQAAKMLIRDATPSTPISGADQVDSINNRLMADRLGWFHVKPNGGTFDVIAAGGASAGGSQVKNTIDAGDPLLNAMEVRWHYTVNVSNPANPVVTVQPVSNVYPW